MEVKADGIFMPLAATMRLYGGSRHMHLSFGAPGGTQDAYGEYWETRVVVTMSQCVVRKSSGTFEAPRTTI